ncbi:hypothetical protein A9Q87_04650 [Flavobacteriales bacterium 34_180_T64]|nr:hypothetical protein A9Q87_04650 [Flavobacteriales bacterium 34_180_T64]
MASVNFLYRSTRNKSNLTLRLLFRFEEQDYVYGAKTKLQVTSNYWENVHFKKHIKDVDDSNTQLEVKTELNKISSQILDTFNKTNPSQVNKGWLENQINEYYNPRVKIKIPMELVKFLDFYKDYRANELKERTVKNLKVIQNKLKRFEIYRDKVILIKDINDQFKNEFVNYYRLEKYSQNTIQREFSYIKTYCRYARYLGLETHHQLDFLTIKAEKVEKIYLTYNELDTIQNIAKHKLTESLENARDWLITSCFTGQRISDFMKFNSKQIRIENDKHLVEFTQTKTGKNMTIPLHPKVLEVLSKRDGEFPRPISDQKYNDYIKQVCKIAEINERIAGSKKVKDEDLNSKYQYRKETGKFEKWELITSHVGRRSFATNFYGTIPTSYLIYVTGHSTERMFLNYIGKSNKDLAMELTNYF